jgi:hypothetical protein
MFVYAPELLCKGSFSAIFLATASAVLGITALAAAVHTRFFPEAVTNENREDLITQTNILSRYIPNTPQGRISILWGVRMKSY